MRVVQARYTKEERQLGCEVRVLHTTECFVVFQKVGNVLVELNRTDILSKYSFSVKTLTFTATDRRGER